jgi:hypothetical protein
MPRRGCARRRPRPAAGGRSASEAFDYTSTGPAKLGHFNVVHTVAKGSALTRPQKAKKPRWRGFPYAPERTRTSTDQSVHKALNQVRAVWMLWAASKLCKLRGLLDALDAMEGADVVTRVVRRDDHIGAIVTTCVRSVSAI